MERLLPTSWPWKDCYPHHGHGKIVTHIMAMERLLPTSWPWKDCYPHHGHGKIVTHIMAMERLLPTSWPWKDCYPHHGLGKIVTHIMALERLLPTSWPWKDCYPHQDLCRTVMRPPCDVDRPSRCSSNKCVTMNNSLLKPPLSSCSALQRGGWEKRQPTSSSILVRLWLFSLTSCRNAAVNGCSH